MKKWLIIPLLLLLLSPFAMAQLGTFSDVPVEINGEESSFENGLAVFRTDVVIRYGATTIYCDYAQYNPDSHDALLRGNVRIYGEGRLFVGERAIYNFETKQLHAADFRGETYPFKFTSDYLNSIGPKAFEIRDAIMTTSDSSKPDYYLKAKTVRFYQNDRVIFSNVTVYLGKTPIFWFPYIYQSLQRDSGFLMRPGYQSIWGAYLLTSYSFPISDNTYGKLHLDLRTLRGPAIGLDVLSKTAKEGENWGKFTSYYSDDRHPEENDTSYARGPIGEQRYRLSLQERVYFTSDIYASIDINKLSDALFLQDYVPSQFQVDPQPDNVVSLTKWDEDYAITGIVRAQLNNFFETTERLPEFSLDVKRQPLLDTPIFYEGETSFARLSRNFPNGSGFPDYSTSRLDSYIEFLYPKTYFGWLSFTPRLGLRGTYYSSTGNSGPTIFDQATPDLITGIPTATTNGTTAPIAKGGAIFRPVITAGFEASFKLSKSYDNVETRTLGFDGLMHIIQPYTDFSYVYTGQNPNNILQFDRINPSTQLAPMDLSSFNSIDSITNWTIWRLGVRNRIETRRDNDTFTWLDLDTYFDVNLQEPQYPGITYRQGTFSNIFNNLHWNPLPWLGAEIDTQVPVSSKGFTEITSYLNFLVTPNLKVSLGDSYINNNPFFVNSNLITFNSTYRINDNWAVSAIEQYEAADHVLEYQSYQVHRDLSSWTAAMGIYVRDNKVGGLGSIDWGFMLTFTLKDFPSISSPISFDPQQSSSQGR